MSAGPWMTARLMNGIMQSRGVLSQSETAKKFGVSERSVQRVWMRGDSDGRYHAWSIVSDPSDRAFIRSAWRFEKCPGEMTPEDWTYFEILRAVRRLGPEVVRDALAGIMQSENSPRPPRAS